MWPHIISNFVFQLQFCCKIHINTLTSSERVGFFIMLLTFLEENRIVCFLLTNLFAVYIDKMTYKSKVFFSNQRHYCGPNVATLSVLAAVKSPCVRHARHYLKWAIRAGSSNEMWDTNAMVVKRLTYFCRQVVM